MLMIYRFSTSVAQPIRFVDTYKKKKRNEEPIEVGPRGESLMFKSTKNFRFLILREVSHKSVCIPDSSALVGLI